MCICASRIAGAPVRAPVVRGHQRTAMNNVSRHAHPFLQHNIEHARVYNQRSIAWPLGSAVRIPLDQVVTHFGEFAALPRAVDPAVADVSVTPATSSSAVTAAAGVSSSSTREAASGSMDVETRDSSTVSSDAAASAAPSSRPVLAPISLSISKPATSAAGKDHSALPPVFMA
ncbi:hypothetical protein EON66_04825 [archaeon]|nr:MAG: hypothetical protein EON66_04825 [archaeon]